MVSVEERLKQLNGIKEEVKLYENQLLHDLGWTREKLPKLTEVKQEIVEPEYDVAGSSCSVNRQRNIEHQALKSVDYEDMVELCSDINQKRSSTSNTIDLMKLKRDLKRRRAKYRTSSAPFTYTEEIRELINLQMELVRENKRN